MEIIDKKKFITLADMAEGQVYKITLSDNKIVYVMPVYNGDLNTNYDFCGALVDLQDGRLFDYDSSDLIKVEEVSARMIIQ